MLLTKYKMHKDIVWMQKNAVQMMDSLTLSGPFCKEIPFPVRKRPFP